MAKFSAKMKGKEVGQAGIYAEPHTMSGKKITAKGLASKGVTGAKDMSEMNISVDGISKKNGKPINPYGKIEMRGAGAATKGRMSSGKMG
jgi:hypothetical protein